MQLIAAFGVTKVKGFLLLMVCSMFIFFCVLTVDFVFGLLDYIHYKEEFVLLSNRVPKLAVFLFTTLYERCPG